MRLIGILAIVFLATTTSPALAFDDGGPGDVDSSAYYEPALPDEPSPSDERAPDYRYSGNGFNFSMSRNQPEPGEAHHAHAAGDKQAPHSPRRPNVVQRLFHGLFGD